MQHVGISKRDWKCNFGIKKIFLILLFVYFENRLRYGIFIRISGFLFDLAWIRSIREMNILESTCHLLRYFETYLWKNCDAKTKNRKFVFLWRNFETPMKFSSFNPWAFQRSPWRIVSLLTVESKGFSLVSNPAGFGSLMLGSPQYSQQKSSGTFTLPNPNLLFEQV